jgi:hypothetical protein
MRSATVPGHGRTRDAADQHDADREGLLARCQGKIFSDKENRARDHARVVAEEQSPQGCNRSDEQNVRLS